MGKERGYGTAVSCILIETTRSREGLYLEGGRLYRAVFGHLGGSISVFGSSIGMNKLGSFKILLRLCCLM